MLQLPPTYSIPNHWLPGFGPAALAIGIGVFSIILGFRKKDKALCQILGHTRFSCYFLIAFYPMQAALIWLAVGPISRQS